MRAVATSLILIFIATSLVLSCKKHNNPAPDSDLKHKWQIVSLNGEALRYVGQPADYWDFRNNDTLIEFIGGKYDTARYQLGNGGKTLTLAAFGGPGFALALNVKTLTSSQLILSGAVTDPTIHILDSLRR